MKKRRHGRSNRGNNYKKQPKVLLDDRIEFREVKVIDETGENLGTFSTDKALELARSKNLNLLCISEKGDVPICRILDYGKFRFEKQKKEKMSKKNQTKIVIKEYRVSINTSDHDISYRVGHIKEALQKGQHVKISVKLFGRFLGIEGAGFDVIEKMIGQLSEDIMVVEKEPVRNNRYVDVYLAPSKSVIQKLKIEQQAQKRKEKELENQKSQNNNKINVRQENIPKGTDNKQGEEHGSKTEN